MDTSSHHHHHHAMLQPAAGLTWVKRSTQQKVIPLSSLPFPSSLTTMSLLIFFPARPDEPCLSIVEPRLFERCRRDAICSWLSA